MLLPACLLALHIGCAVKKTTVGFALFLIRSSSLWVESAHVYCNYHTTPPPPPLPPEEHPNLFVPKLSQPVLQLIYINKTCTRGKSFKLVKVRLKCRGKRGSASIGRRAIAAEFWMWSKSHALLLQLTGDGEQKQTEVRMRLSRGSLK